MWEMLGISRPTPDRGLGTTPRRSTRLAEALRIGLVSIGMLTFGGNVLRAADFYVAPNPGSGADGSLGRPWSLAAALAGPAAVHPGDTIWLRGGTYTIPSGGNILCGLRGTAAAPISVAQYPGERATIDIKGAAQGFFFTNSPNPSGAAYVNFKDFEVTNSDTNRSTRFPVVAFYVRTSDHLKFINLIVHDVGMASI